MKKKLLDFLLEDDVIDTDVTNSEQDTITEKRYFMYMGRSSITLKINIVELFKLVVDESNHVKMELISSSDNDPVILPVGVLLKNGMLFEIGSGDDSDLTDFQNILTTLKRSTLLLNAPMFMVPFTNVASTPLTINAFDMLPRQNQIRRLTTIIPKELRIAKSEFNTN